VAEPLAEGPVADLIVVLQEDDKGGGRQVGARLATCLVLERRMLALINKTFRETASQLRMGMLRVVRVVTVLFAGQYRVQAVMQVIVPLRVVFVAAPG
jgi:ABC-type thiamine transport system ATPase subunit